MADTYKFRIDHHGSLVRPPELLAARDRHAAGEIDDAELRALEDEAIAESVRHQRKLRLSVATDGDYRHADFRGAILGAVTGFRRSGGTDARGREEWTVDGEVKADGPLIADGFGPVKELAGFSAAPKATLPSPAYLAAGCYDPAVSGAAYKSLVELGVALGRIIRDEIELLIAQGVRLIQLNNFRYGAYLSGRGGEPLTLDEAIAVDSVAVDVTSKPEGVRIGLCPTHRAGEAVDRDAATRLFDGVPVDRWVLPYDQGTQGERDLLRAVPADRDAALGVVDPTVAGLEDVETVMQRLDVAAELKEIEDLAVTPSRGFCDVAGRAAISADDQRRKLIHVETVARMFWGNEL